MKSFALVCTALLAAPILAQRPAGGAVSAGGFTPSPGVFSPVTAPTTTLQPTVAPPTAAPGTPFSQVEATAPLTPTPRAAGGFVPRGPNAFDATPSPLGQTFQRPVLSSDFPNTRVFDPAASVPTAFLPAQNAGEPEVIQNLPVVLVPGTFPGTFEAVPAARFFGQLPSPAFNEPASELANVRPRAFPQTPVVVNFPPGARVVTGTPSAFDGPVSIIQRPVAVPGLGAGPSFQSEVRTAPPRVLPGAPAAERQEPIQPVPGTGFRVVRPAQARTD